MRSKQLLLCKAPAAESKTIRRFKTRHRRHPGQMSQKVWGSNPASLVKPPFGSHLRKMSPLTHWSAQVPPKFARKLLTNSSLKTKFTTANVQGVLFRRMSRHVNTHVGRLQEGSFPILFPESLIDSFSVCWVLHIEVSKVSRFKLVQWTGGRVIQDQTHGFQGTYLRIIFECKGKTHR